MKTLTAIDVMVPLKEYPHALATDTLRDAARMLVEAQIRVSEGKRSMPRVVLVFDDEHKLLGAARRRDILKGLEPDRLEELDEITDVHIKSEADPDLAEVLSPDDSAHWRQRFETPVGEVVREIVARVEATDSLTKIIYEFVSNDSHMAVVVDADEVVGVVRTVDVLRRVYEAITVATP